MCEVLVPRHTTLFSTLEWSNLTLLELGAFQWACEKFTGERLEARFLLVAFESSFYALFCFD